MKKSHIYAGIAGLLFTSVHIAAMDVSSLNEDSPAHLRIDYADQNIDANVGLETGAFYIYGTTEKWEQKKYPTIYFNLPDEAQYKKDQDADPFFTGNPAFKYEAMKMYYQGKRQFNFFLSALADDTGDDGASWPTSSINTHCHISVSEAIDDAIRVTFEALEEALEDTESVEYLNEDSDEELNEYFKELLDFKTIILQGFKDKEIVFIEHRLAPQVRV
jgi:hypothetical protein